MSVAALVVATVCLTVASPLTQYHPATGAPETFSATAQAKGAPGVAAAIVRVVIQRYSPADVRTVLEQALETGGYPAFVSELRTAPVVGYVEHGTSKFAIRYARETETAKGRRIEVVTDTPIYFLGGGAPQPKPRQGFEVAVLQLEVDSIGFGSGVMAAAARLKSAPEGGVQIEDYADEPIRLPTVRRSF